MEKNEIKTKQNNLIINFIKANYSSEVTADKMIKDLEEENLNLENKPTGLNSN